MALLSAKTCICVLVLVFYPIATGKRTHHFTLDLFCRFLKDDAEWKKPIRTLLHFFKVEAEKLENEYRMQQKSLENGKHIDQILFHNTKFKKTVDPLNLFERLVYEFIFGNKSYQSELFEGSSTSDEYFQYPTADGTRAERFNKKKAAFVPIPDMIQQEHCLMNVTSKDAMQTALDAFAIIMHGSQKDIRRIPRMFILQSARAISMMKIEREKITTTWPVIVADRSPDKLPYFVLELYRPLFRYLSGNDMARLNLSDERVLTYIGTYEYLNRHQVGVVASKYIKMNPNWSEPKYLNIMNNLICGVPVTYLRKIPLDSFLQLSHQVFYHIRACDKIQRRFILSLLSRTQALGKSFSWTAQDVSHLGLLIAEVQGEKLKNINPEAMAGLTAHVIEEMLPKNLAYFTSLQVHYLNSKAFNVYSRKMKQYQGKLQNSVNLGNIVAAHFILLILISIINFK